MRKALIIFGVLVIATAVAIGVIQHNHPIFLKYLGGEASSLGRPIPAKVYVDGRMNNGIRVYKDPYHKNDYILNLKDYEKIGMLEYIDIALDDKWIGRPVGSNKDCYDTINGKLYQDEVGAHFVDFKDDIKGFNFNPELRFNNKSIEFKVPLHELKFDSVRIELEDN